MQRLKYLVISLVFVISSSLPVYAAPASASSLDVLEDFGPSGLPSAPDDDQDFDDWAEEELSEEEEEALANPDPAEELLLLLKQLLGGSYAASPSEIDVLEDSSDSEILGEITVFDAPMLLSLASEENFVNCLRYDVSVNDVDYTLLFAPSYADQLYVDSQRRLWNMGTSSIQGLVVDGSFNPYQITGTLVYLAPCLGNNFSTNKNYGSPNYFRRYYWSSSSGYDRLTYDDTYVQITVTDAHHTFVSSDLLTYILIFLVGGGVLICWLNRFRHY